MNDGKRLNLWHLNVIFVQFWTIEFELAQLFARGQVKLHERVRPEHERVETVATLEIQRTKTLALDESFAEARTSRYIDRFEVGGLDEHELEGCTV